MAKNTPHSPTQPAAPAGAKGIGRIRELFSRKKTELPQGAQAAAAGQMAGAHAAQSHAMKAGAMTQAAVGADRVVGRAHGAISRVNSFVYYGGFLAGGLAVMGKLPLVGKFFKGASEVAKAPRNYMDNTTVRDALHTPTAVMDKVKGVAEKAALKGGARDALLGEDGKLLTEGMKGTQALAARVANGIGGARGSVDAVEKNAVGWLSRAAKRVFDPLGDTVGRVGKDQRLRLAEKVTGTATKHHGNALSALEGAMGAGGENGALAPVREALSKAKGLMGDGSARLSTENMTALNETMGAAREGLAGIAKGAVDKKTLTSLQKGMQQVENATGAFNQRSGMAEKIRDLPNVVKGAPKTLANANLTNVALKGAVVTGTTLQVTSTARGIAEKVHMLKQMHCDMTGEEKISTRKLLMSKNVPDLVKEARGQIMKEFGPRVVLNFANTIATYGFMKNNNKGTMLLSGGLMALTQLHTAKVQSYELLPMYEALNQQPQIQDVQYAAFISSASKDAAKAGGIESALVQALAVDYAKEGARPAEILKEIETGRFDERALEKAQSNRAAMEKMGGHELAAQPEGAMGAHTQREMARRQTEGASQLRG